MIMSGFDGKGYEMSLLKIVISKIQVRSLQRIVDNLGFIQELRNILKKSRYS